MNLFLKFLADWSFEPATCCGLDWGFCNPSPAGPPHPDSSSSPQAVRYWSYWGSNSINSLTVPAANMALNAPSNIVNDWIIDTITNEHDLLFLILQSAKSLAYSSSSVRLPNGNKLLINHIGSVALSHLT